jgi:hypothetical protein
LWRRVSSDDLKQISDLVQPHEKVSSWWICDGYELRGEEIVARHPLPWVSKSDSFPDFSYEQWREYKPLDETPDLFLKLAGLHKASDFETAAVAFSSRYGVPGGSSSERGGRPDSMDLRQFRLEAKRAWDILEMYEAVFNEDWEAARSALEEQLREHARAPGYLSEEELPHHYLLDALVGALTLVNRTVSLLCSPRMLFTESGFHPKPNPLGIKSTWHFDNLLGAAYLQMYWLMTTGSEVTRCEHCGRMIALSRSNPEGRKRRRDKRFCDDACRQARHRIKKRAGDTDVS